MRINHAEYTISELVDQFSRKDLKINRQYQRGEGIWPLSAKTYFIDTILENYPFPKLYFYQIFDRIAKKPIMEVVDGQQRLLTIIDFYKDDLKLNKGSQTFSGKAYSDLSEEQQESFSMYRVSVDVILAAQRPELLEMFRRMNAYTAPLNPAEKRHAKYQGLYKWFAVETSDKIGPIIEEFGILTPKQIIRMNDAELIAEIVIVLERGLINRSENEINRLYERNDKTFPEEQDYFSFISGFFNLLAEKFGELRNTLLMKPYAIHSFFAAYAHILRGIPNGERDLGIPCRNKEINTDKETIKKLMALSDAHEVKDVNGEYKEYVSATLNSTTKSAQRKARTKVLIEILDPK
ncbi:DUF262 domain-containing protein [Acidithiobacillus ferriphilus]|uniref:DUF262 domain-containing protein n=1 Tax=Acidithiobacillus ferriphilus TaxID=1689834 RepID=UPI001C07087F|nr:DUF262 domain-containing protein [Acidithiobacillus ferriphilus]MBU2844334.1 DUF262 domain-containing protein [Acidithiobacillus ferriphilus]